MSKFCSNCGKELAENSTFCPNCGTQIGGTNPNQNNSSNTKVNAPVLEYRDIAIAIILSIVTCGIYGIFWIISLTNDANKVADRPTDTSGGMVILLTIITCGIYGIYWNYKMGQKRYEAGQRYNKSISDNSVLYLVLSLFGLAIVNYALMQSDLNKFSNK